jgi:hypothetical protein
MVCKCCNILRNILQASKLLPQDRRMLREVVLQEAVHHDHLACSMQQLPADWAAPVAHDQGAIHEIVSAHAPLI